MELPSHQEGDEMPIPLNSMIHHHGHGHMIHHHDPASHIIPSSGGGPPHQIPSNGPPISHDHEHDHDHDHEHLPFKKMVRYRECLKNHAASMGGNATDGCGEFMPSGEEGTLEALTCSACNCHRNFHRKEVEGEPSSCDGCYPNPRMGRKLFMGGHHNALAYHHHHHHGAPLISSRPVPPHQMIMSYNMAGSLPSESDEHVDGGGGGGGVVVRPTPVVKKRFRTKFTQEQKEKMLSFAEKVGWKIQKQEESVVQQFCQEVGVKRRVLKVWMHNNKHNLAKKNLNHSNPQNQV